MIYFQVWLIQALAAACSGCWHPFKETRHARHACTDIDNRWRSVAATPCVRALTWTYTPSQSQPKVRYLRKFDRGMLFHVIGIQHPAVQWLSTKSPSREGFFFGASECAPDDVWGILHGCNHLPSVATHGLFFAFWILLTLLAWLSFKKRWTWLRLAAFVTVDGKVLGRLCSAALPPSLSLSLLLFDLKLVSAVQQRLFRNRMTRKATRQHWKV